MYKSAVALTGLLIVTACQRESVTHTEMAADAPASVKQLSLQSLAESDGHFKSAAKAVVAVGDQRTGFVVANKKKGLELFDLTGKKLGASGEGEYAVLMAAENATLLLSQDRKSGDLQSFRYSEKDQSLQFLNSVTHLDYKAETICGGRYRGAVHFFVADENGYLDHYLWASDVKDSKARLVRRLPIGTAVSACAVAENDGHLYVAETDVALWRYPIDPEVELQREALALGKPAGDWTSVSAMTLVSVQEKSLLFVMHEGKQLAAYQIQPALKKWRDLNLLVNAVDVVEGSEAIAISARGDRLFVQDDSDDKGGSNIKLFDLSIMLADRPALPTPKTNADTAALLTASVETAPVQDDGDAADDPAIWVNEKKPEASYILGTQKQAGLAVYDLQGKLLHFRDDGKLNNVDLRQHIVVNGKPLDIAVASNRSNNSVMVYQLSDRMPYATDVSQGGLLTDLNEIYGICLANSEGKLSVFATDKTGRLQQWHLLQENNNWQLKAVRQWRFDSLIEGCVVDDMAGRLWVAEEDRGLWLIDLNSGAQEKKLTADVSQDLVADVEGVSLWQKSDGSGFLVVSSQGDNRYAVFDRQPPHRFIGNFRVVADAESGIDGASETDGLDVSSANLGGSFSEGLLVVQDGRNLMPAENQNFKLVPWSRVMPMLAR